MKLEGIDHVALAVPEIESTVAWYTEVLGFERKYAEYWGGVPAFIGKGTTALALFPRAGKRAGRKGGPMLHLAMRASHDEFVRAQEELRKRDIPYRFEDHAIAHSIYFHDLNDLPLEITTYEIEVRGQRSPRPR